jgi:hypothetical protein
LDLEKIVSDLTAEKDRIVRAIEALLAIALEAWPEEGCEAPTSDG